MTTSAAAKPSRSTALRMAWKYFKGALHEQTETYLYFDLGWLRASRYCGDAGVRATAGREGRFVQREGRNTSKGESPLHHAHRPPQARTNPRLHVRR